MKPRKLRAVATAVAAAVFAAAALADPPPPSDDAAALEPAYGTYLAARYAGSIGDTAAAADFYLKALEGDPDNPGLMRRAFALTVQDSRFEIAVGLARRLAETSSTASIANLVLVLNAIREGRYEDTRMRLEASPEAGINALFGPVIRAWTFAGEGRADDAIGALEPLGAENSFHAFRDFHQALMFENLGRAEEAEAAYAAALDRQTGSVRIVLGYGRMLERAGRAGEAAVIYGEFLDQYPDNPLIGYAAERAGRGEVPPPLVEGPADGVAEALFGTAHALVRENARPAATIYLRLATFVRPDFPDAYLLLASLLQDSGQYENALREFRKVADHEALGHGIKLEMATVIDRLDRPDEAVALLESLIEARPGDIRTITTLADVFREHERYDEARIRYDEAIALLPEIEQQHWPLLYARGIANERTKRWPEAEADFLKALELEPEQPLVLNYLGYSWIEMERNIDQATEMIRRAVELRPNDGYIVDSLGWAMYRLGRYPEAVEKLESAVLLRPEDPTINDHLGDAYAKVGRHREARFQWQHALALEPDDEQLAALEAKLATGPLTATNERP